MDSWYSLHMDTRVEKLWAHVSAPHRNSPLLSKPADQKVKPLLTVTTDDVDGMVFL